MSDKFKWYEKEYILALCFLSVVFAPLGILLLCSSEKYSKRAKAVLCVVSAVFFLGVSFFGVCMLSTGPDFLSFGIGSAAPRLKVRAETTAKKTEKEKPPRKPKQKTKEAKNKVYVTSGGKKYHLSGSCGKGKYFVLSLSTALEKGYKACKKCASGK